MEGINFLAGSITWIVGLITLIVFFVMAAALANISKNVKEIRQVLKAWGNEKGYGVTYYFICEKCKQKYQGKLPNCPVCGDEKVY